MAGRDKERDRGHAHRSNESKPVQAASAELTRQGIEACAVYSGLQRAFWTVIVSAMRQLSAVPWLSSGGRIALSILCVATRVCGAFGLPHRCALCCRRRDEESNRSRFRHVSSAKRSGEWGSGLHRRLSTATAPGFVCGARPADRRESSSEARESSSYYGAHKPRPYTKSH